jgi:hypothetical protein
MSDLVKEATHQKIGFEQDRVEMHGVSVKAFRLYEDCEGVHLEFARQITSEQAEPAFLRLICKLFTCLGTFKFEPSDILKVADHFNASFGILHPNRVRRTLWDRNFLE